MRVYKSFSLNAVLVLACFLGFPCCSADGSAHDDTSLATSSTVLGNTAGEERMSPEASDSTQGNSFSKSPLFKKAMGTLAVVLLALLLLNILTALQSTRKSKSKILIISPRFYYSLIVLLSVLLISLVGLATIPPLQPVLYAGQNQDVNESTPPNFSYWPTELDQREAAGYIQQTDSKIKYTCKVARQSGVETHEWWAAGIRNRLIIEGETARAYIRNSRTPFAVYWAPSLYSVFDKYRKYYGKDINVFDCSTSVTLDLKGVHMLGPELEKTIPNANLTIDADGHDRWRIMLNAGSQKLVVLNLGILRDKGRIEEHYKYYDYAGNVVYMYGLEY
jgi:hypothetical protein